ncbi:DUF2937 family protein [Phreatobacter sp.]|uniref:DUF2937 family protein n=1 Tax=Phreatobacter sp. TaxID=1966341 RepID=UPI0022CCA7AC|nr:DUF2937 family protein [Phreatobacter sp.]MCZ8314767.1 DUF2937 family protein [Phreatobacter sp.]
MILKRLVFALALFLATLASQVPEFAQQYRQRLGGAVDELNRIITAFDADAARMALTRESGLERLKANADRFVRQRAEQIEGDIARAARLERQLQSYAEAGPFNRVALLARDHDADIARRAFEAFEPAVPVTSEGLMAAVAGFLVGWVGGRALILPIQRRRKQPRLAA